MTLIAQISDSHVCAQGVPAYRVVETNMLAERAVGAVNRLDPQPDFVIVTGDLVDHGKAEEYDLARRIMDDLRAPYAVIAGNHDSSAALKRCYADRAWAQQIEGDSLQFSLRVGDLRIIGLNSAVDGKHYGLLSEAELAWLEAELERDQSVPTIVALHHPPIVTGLQGMDRSKLRNSDEFAALLARYDTILRVICGHDHRPVFAPFGGTTVTIAPGLAHQVTLDLRADQPQTFNFEPAAFLLHRYTPETGLVTHMAYVESFPGPFPFWPADGVTWP
ncbi:MAG: phosphodiesterase [Pseudomonadota bacterium]